MQEEFLRRIMRNQELLMKKPIKAKRRRRPAPKYPLPPIKVLILERTACYGSCPIYTVSVDDNCEVRWLGRDYVEIKGARIWAISRIKMDLLHKCLERYDFLNLDKPQMKLFGLCGSDGPSCITTAIFADGSRKRINHNMGDESMPEQLTRLEDRIDAILGTGKYVGVSL